MRGGRSDLSRFGVNIIGEDRTGLLRDVSSCVAQHGGNIASLHHSSGLNAQLYLDVEGVDDRERLCDELRQISGVTEVELTESPGTIFGIRVIVVGGGAQVAQVVAGAVSEADRHNIRGERISVDTIPLIGEQLIADAVRAVAFLPRAKILVLAGSLMGGEITRAVLELREKYGIPVISLNMAGSVPDAADLVVSDPVQAGVMAVMHIAETAKFDLARVRGKRL
jgi:energy-converting hydrogenase B subunit Q